MSTEQAILEADSKKRGRPRLYDRSHVERVAMIVAPDVRSARHKQNRLHAQEGFQSLYDLEANSPVPGVEYVMDPPKNRLRVSILEQLGRLKFETGCGDEYVRDLGRQASDLLRDDPAMTVHKVARALVVIRKQWRGGAK